MGKRICGLAVSVFSLFSHPVLAEYHVVATLSGGPAWYTAGKTQTIELQPGFENTYVASTPTKTLAQGEAFLGVQRAMGATLLGQLGLAFAGTGDARLQGRIWETGDPTFDNFSYQYKIDHMHVAIKGKMLYQILPAYLPYLSGSIGLAYNHAHAFTMSSSIYEAVAEPLFINNTQTALTYTVGGGIQKVLNQNWQAGVGYEFADWGKSSLSHAPGQTINTGLALNHLYTNQLQFNVSYIF